MNIGPELMKKIEYAQAMEATEAVIYEKLAQRTKSEKTRNALHLMAEQERGHYNFLKEITQKDVEPNNRRVWRFVMLSRIFGFTFGIRLMERSEHDSIQLYRSIRELNPTKIEQIIKEESEHENRDLDMVETKVLEYAGSLVLGMNDALVELTGALAGLTLALQDTRLIALTGYIIGIAAAMSMGASEYLSSKEEEKQNPFRASLYTGTAYLVTVLILVTPYVFISNVFVALATALVLGLMIIFVFNAYISVLKNASFRRKFSEMAIISITFAAINFGIGFAVRYFFGIEV